METLLISIDYRDPAWIAIAFAFGLLFQQVRLPPMVGFLVAGFVLNALGAEADVFLKAAADLGITLLLFTIGLKLRLGTMIKTEVWATTGAHMAGSILLTFVMLWGLGGAGVLMFDQLTPLTILMLAFAFSFSSTVFAVKTLEERGSMSSRYGQVAIGILVMQDMAAVAFLALSTGKVPSPWALLLLALIPGRHLLGRVLGLAGHGELLTIFGFALALGGAATFEMVGMKADLGALVFGVLLSGHPKGRELANSLMGFKEVFLVCFFLTIGLTGLPTLESFLTALVLLCFVPLKSVLFYLLLTRFRLRSWGASLASLALGTYSEFGLIVTAIVVSGGWLAPEWVTVTALTVAASFILAAPFNVQSNVLYARFRSLLKRLESKKRLPGDENIVLGDGRILIFGMGRVGLAAYDQVHEQLGDCILGIDQDEIRVQNLAASGRNVVLGDATSLEFWSRLDQGAQGADFVLLALPNQSANLAAARQLRQRAYIGPIVATAKYPDELELLKANGVDEVFNIYSEAGASAATRLQMFIETEPVDPSR
ncbi:cation:proton antiporter [Magnetospira thiophila]